MYANLSRLANYYENLPMQYTEIFLAVEIENFIEKKNLCF